MRKNLTWAEFKALIESKGVKDEDDIALIAYGTGLANDPVAIRPDADGDGWEITG